MCEEKRRFAIPRVGYQKVTATSSVFSLTIPPGTRSVDLEAEVQNIRFRDDGVDPTAAIGQLILTTTVPLTYFGNLSKLRFIAAVAGAILHAEFYKT